jgi:hypothetical protein
MEQKKRAEIEAKLSEIAREGVVKVLELSGYIGNRR